MRLANGQERLRMVMWNRKNVADKLQRYKEAMFCICGAFRTWFVSYVGRACPCLSFALEVG
jgi:hypothetical protein